MTILRNFLACLGLFLAATLAGTAEGQTGGGFPRRYEASFGFGLIRDHNGAVIITPVISTSDAWRFGIRPGMELIGWNSLPVEEKLKKMRIGRYRSLFPLLDEDGIRLLLLPRGRPGSQAEVFVRTESGNQKGIRLTAR